MEILKKKSLDHTDPLISYYNCMPHATHNRGFQLIAELKTNSFSEPVSQMPEPLPNAIVIPVIEMIKKCCRS